jgi:hypothetical protein
MKRSKHIHLVLITAALASCNREILHLAPGAVLPADSTLTAAPVYDDDYPDCCQDIYSSLWNYSFSPYGNYYIGPLGGRPIIPYFPGRGYRKGLFWRHNTFVVRKGFGTTGVASTAS